MDRPSTAVRCAPGGNSTLNLGGFSAADAPVTSSNLFANGANQNAGNGITDRPSTAVRCAPGGASSIVFGGDQPVAQAQAMSRVAPGGASTVVLGMSEGETFHRDANAPSRAG